MVDNLCEVWCKVFPHQVFYRHKTGFPTYKLSLGKTDLVLDRTGGFWVLAPLTHLPTARKPV